MWTAAASGFPRPPCRSWTRLRPARRRSVEHRHGAQRTLPAGIACPPAAAVLLPPGGAARRFFTLELAPPGRFDPAKVTAHALKLLSGTGPPLTLTLMVSPETGRQFWRFVFTACGWLCSSNRSPPSRWSPPRLNRWPCDAPARGAPRQASPSSFRTCRTPSHIAASLRFAAQRAVWLRPQSGAKTRRSAGACSRQHFTRRAMSSGVST